MERKFRAPHIAATVGALLWVSLFAVADASDPPARRTTDYTGGARPAASQLAPASAVRPAAHHGRVSAGQEIYFDEPGASAASCCDGCDSCGACGYDIQFGFPCGKTIASYGGIEYLVWWRKGICLPPLLSTGAPGVSDGVIGAPGTQFLFGNEQVDNGAKSGGRLFLGTWLDDCRTWAVEGRYFQLGESSVRYTAVSDGGPGSPLLARPFFNVNLGQQDSELIASPGLIGGAIDLRTTSNVVGAELRLRRLLTCCDDSRLDFVTGYQFTRFDEDLTIQSTATALANNITRQVSETFEARNEFHGGVIGLLAEVNRCGWTMEVLTKVALGTQRQLVLIDGVTRNIDAGGNIQDATGGLLTQNSNIGRFARNDFAVLPEVGVTFAYHISDHMKMSFGYSMMYWSQAVQPGHQIDRNIDPTQAVARPEALIRNNEFWVQGLNFGLHCDF